MMEKSSKIHITQQDLDDFYLGILSENLKRFGIKSLEEFRRILELEEYELES